MISESDQSSWERRYHYKKCPHCDRELSTKKLREHKKLFYKPETKEWYKEEHFSSDESSDISSFEDVVEQENTQMQDFEELFSDDDKDDDNNETEPAPLTATVKPISSNEEGQ